MVMDEATATTRYYHVAPADVETSHGLLSYEVQEERGWEPEWKWGEENVGLDTDVVCLFATLNEAREFHAEYLPDGVILAIDLPSDEDERAAWGIHMVTVSEGYPAVVNAIEAQWITERIGG
jgi:hypothetical protein